MAALTFKIGTDTSALRRGLTQARGMLKTFAKSAAVISGAGLAAGMAGLTVAAGRLKDALDFGSEVSDVAANTGLLAGDVAVLDRAFRDAGAGGGKVQSVINKMQRTVEDANDGLTTQIRAFEKLGLGVDELLQMKPREQFEAITQALAGVTNETTRSATAMAIFGRAGGDLRSLFQNPEAIENAARSVGSAADILNKNADDFDRTSDLLNNLSDKLRGVFLGLAEGINPVLLPLLERLEGMDMAAKGRKFAQAVAGPIQMLFSGRGTEALGLSLKIGAKDFVNTVTAGLWGVFIGGAALLAKSIAASARIMTNRNFWNGIVTVFRSIFLKMEAILLDFSAKAFGDPEGNKKLLSDFKTEQAARFMDRATDFLKKAVDQEGGKDLVKDAIGEGIAAFHSMKAGPLIDAAEDRRALSDLFRSVAAGGEEAKKAGLGLRAAMPSGGELAKALTAGAAQVGRKSLARVGGAGAPVAAVRNLERKKVSLLERIARNTERPPAAVFA